MKRNLILPSALAFLLALIPSAGFAQTAKNVTLHVNPRWKQCSFQLDPSLTQSAWHQFTAEAGLVSYFRPLTDAKPMGAGNFELSALQWQTGIDDETSAWNDTFVHPFPTHWLFEGSGLAFPGLTFRGGVTDRIDAGAYFTRNPQANYGFYGAQVQYALVNDETRNWAASTRASFVSLFGPEDLTFTVYGLDLLASRAYTVSPKWLTVSPYAGVSGYLATSHERTAAVSLADETVSGAQAMVGAVAEVSRFRIAMEYNTARVSSRSIKIGVTF